METCISDTYVCYSLCTEHGDTRHTWRSFVLFIFSIFCLPRYHQLYQCITQVTQPGVYDSWQISLSFFFLFCPKHQHQKLSETEFLLSLFLIFIYPDHRLLNFSIRFQGGRVLYLSSSKGMYYFSFSFCLNYIVFFR